MHKCLRDHFDRRPRVIICDVRLSDQFHGDEQLIEIQDRCSTSKRFYFADELRARVASGNKEDFAAEGTAYVHQYHVADDIPADIASALR